jgi:hypothetical protein
MQASGARKPLVWGANGTAGCKKAVEAHMPQSHIRKESCANFAEIADVRENDEFALGGVRRGLL